MEIIYERVAAIDVGKKEVAVAVRTPGEGRGAPRVQEVGKFKTFYPVLQVMVAWLVEQRVTHVTMESTGVYWRPVFHALCEVDAGFEILLVNAGHVKNVPGRKTDVKDSEWLAQLLEVGLLRGSFIPPADIAAIREVTRYRKKLIQSRISELSRLGKVCEDAGIKIDSVASSLTTKSARDMVEALIGGERDPRVLADLARGVMRKKIPDLSMALAGRWAAHHAVLARAHLDHLDHLEAMIARLDAQIEEMTFPFQAQVAALCTIPGIGDRTAQVIISEIGVDMSRFPTADHLALLGRAVSGEQRVRGQARQHPHPQREPGDPHRAGRGRLGRRPDQHLPRRPVPSPSPPVREEERRQSGRRDRPQPPDHHLVRPARRRRVPRPRPGLLHPPRHPRHRPPQEPTPQRATRARLHRRGHHRGLNTAPPPSRLHCAPPGAVACPLTIKFHLSPNIPFGDATRRENGAGLPADADALLGCEPVSQSGAGVLT